MDVLLSFYCIHIYFQSLWVKVTRFILKNRFLGWLSIESQPQNHKLGSLIASLVYFQFIERQLTINIKLEIVNIL